MNAEIAGNVLKLDLRTLLHLLLLRIILHLEMMTPPSKPESPKKQRKLKKNGYTVRKKKKKGEKS